MRRKLLALVLFAGLGSCSEGESVESTTAGLGTDSGVDGGPFAGGSGTSADPFLLSTCTELQAMETNLVAYYRLANDIDCTGFDAGDGKGFRPIGAFDCPIDFSGVWKETVTSSAACRCNGHSKIKSL